MTTSTNQNKPIVALAPMDGITTAAFRAIMRKLNPDIYLYSEFTKVDSKIDLSTTRLKYFGNCSNYIIQLYGNDPEKFRESAIKLEEQNVKNIDINMGCSSKKIANSKHGASLMKDPSVAAKIINLIKKNTTLTVSVKTRIGWNNSDGLIDFVNRLIDNGLDFITVHGRTYKQKFNGFANWQPIYELKEAVNIDIIGNGDVKSWKDGIRKQKNLNGFMIGRAALANPFIFNNKNKKITKKQRVKYLIDHIEYELIDKPEKQVFYEIRKFYSGYLNFNNKNNIQYRKLLKCENYHDFKQIINSNI